MNEGLNSSRSISYNADWETQNSYSVQEPIEKNASGGYIPIPCPQQPVNEELICDSFGENRETEYYTPPPSEHFPTAVDKSPEAEQSDTPGSYSGSVSILSEVNVTGADILLDNPSQNLQELAPFQSPYSTETVSGQDSTTIEETEQLSIGQINSQNDIPEDQQQCLNENMQLSHGPGNFNGVYTVAEEEHPSDSLDPRRPATPVTTQLRTTTQGSSHIYQDTPGICQPRPGALASSQLRPTTTGNFQSRPATQTNSRPPPAATGGFPPRPPRPAVLASSHTRLATQANSQLLLASAGGIPPRPPRSDVLANSQTRPASLTNSQPPSGTTGGIPPRPASLTNSQPLLASAGGIPPRPPRSDVLANSQTRPASLTNSQPPSGASGGISLRPPRPAVLASSQIRPAVIRSFQPRPPTSGINQPRPATPRGLQPHPATPATQSRQATPGNFQMRQAAQSTSQTQPNFQARPGSSQPFAGTFHQAVRPRSSQAMLWPTDGKKLIYYL